MLKGKSSKLIAGAVAVSSIATVVVLQCSASAIASRPNSSSSSSSSSQKCRQNAVCGKVTAVSGNQITLSVFGRDSSGRGHRFGFGKRSGTADSSSAADSSSSSAVSTVTTKTITVPDGCKITKKAAPGSADTAAALSDISVGSFIVVSYDTAGNISSIAIMGQMAEKESKYRPISGEVTAVSGSQITLNVISPKRPKHGHPFDSTASSSSSSASSSSGSSSSSSSSSSDSSAAVTTKTITIPDGCKISVKGSDSAASLSDITVGKYIRVKYDENGNISSVTIFKAPQKFNKPSKSNGKAQTAAVQNAGYKNNKK